MLAECLAGSHVALGLIRNAMKTGEMMHTCHPSSCEAEAGGSEGQDYLQPHGQSQTKGQETLSQITLANTEFWAQLAQATRKHICMSDWTFPIPSEKSASHHLTEAPELPAPQHPVKAKSRVPGFLCLTIDSVKLCCLLIN